MPPAFSLVIVRPKAVTGESAQSLGCVCFFSLQKVDMLECNFLTNQAFVDTLHHVKRYRGLSNQYCRVVRDYLICPRNLFLFLFFSSSLPLSCFCFVLFFILFYFLLFFPLSSFSLSFSLLSLSHSFSLFLSLSLFPWLLCHMQHYFCDAWNTFDALIVVGSIVDIAITEVNVSSWRLSMIVPALTFICLSRVLLFLFSPPSLLSFKFVFRAFCLVSKISLFFLFVWFVFFLFCFKFWNDLKDFLTVASFSSLHNPPGMN